MCEYYRVARLVVEAGHRLTRLVHVQAEGGARAVPVLLRNVIHNLSHVHVQVSMLKRTTWC